MQEILDTLEDHLNQIATYDEVFLSKPFRIFTEVYSILFFFSSVMLQLLLVGQSGLKKDLYVRDQEVDISMRGDAFSAILANAVEYGQ
jgi:hypothetical protein